MEARREARARGRVLVAIGGVLAAGVAAGAGLIVRRNRVEEAELWAEAQRTDLPPVPMPVPAPLDEPDPLVEPDPLGESDSLREPEPDSELARDPESALEPEPAVESEPTLASEPGPEIATDHDVPGELGPHDPSYGEVV